MARRVFYSFHFANDCWRTSQVRNIGAIEGNKPTSDNDWEAIKKKGDKAIQDWIDGQLEGRSCAVILVGQETANRKWIKYEIKKAWNSNKGVVGIRIHKLKNEEQKTSIAGPNPFSQFTIGGTSMASIVSLYDSPFLDSKQVYNDISLKIENLIEGAIATRLRYVSPCV